MKILGIVTEEGADLVMTGTTADTATVGETRAAEAEAETETENETSDDMTATAIDLATDTEEPVMMNSLVGVLSAVMIDAPAEAIVIDIAETLIDRQKPG